jgi:hypothetical protein
MAFIMLVPTTGAVISTKEGTECPPLPWVKTLKHKHVKAYKTLLASSLALTFAVSENAQTVIHIAGSTAFRAATITAIEATLSANSGTYTFAYVGTAGAGNEKKASQTIFKGNVKINGNTVPVEFKTSFQGSVGGVADLVNGLTVGTGGSAYPNGGGGWLADSNLPATGGQAVGANAPIDPASVPDVAMSDSFQKSTPFTSTTLSGKIIGIVPFEWVKGLATSLSTLKNLATADSYNLLKGSYTFSGAKVYAIGRDEDSGTRLAAYENASVGKDNGDIGSGPYPSVPQQYQFAASGTPTLWAAPVTVDGFTYNNAGHSGFSSGGTLASTLNTATTVPYVAYLGINDAANVNSGKNGLTFNTKAYSVANVQSGAYTFWGYEHFLYLPTLTGTPLTVALQLETQVATNASVSGVPINSLLKFHRDGDGQPLKTPGTPPNVP